MRFNPLALRDVGAPDKAAPTQPGLVLIKSVQIIGPGGQGNVSYPSITIDAPEAPFSKYRRVLFQFTAIGMANATAAAALLVPRKNGGAFSNTVQYQYNGGSGAAANVFGNASANANAGIPIVGATLTNAQIIRTLEVWMDQYGFDTYLAHGSGGANLQAGAMMNSTAMYQVLANQQVYGGTDYAGLQLNLSAANAFQAPNYTTTNVPAAVFCDVYGWTNK